MSKLLSIIIVSFNTKDVLRNCLQRVRTYTQNIDCETWVADNDSKDGSADMVASEFPEVKLIAVKKNLGFAAGNNLCLRKASGKYFLLLNSDAYLLPGILKSTIQFMEHNPLCGVLGVKLIGEDGKLQPSARMLPTPWLKFLVISGLASRFPHSKALGGPDYPWWDHSSTKVVGWVPGAYFLISKQLTKKIGFLDERYFLYFEEVDFCLQTKRAGFQVIFYPGAKIIHLGGQSSQTTQKRMTSVGKQLIHLRIKSEFRYYRKNFGLGRLLASAGVEIFWNLVVLLRNCLKKGEHAAIRRQEASAILGLIFTMLWQDRFGKETIPL